ncbi:MAG: hypothetical protein AB1547_07930 [Thermodesulfobacteriota bacterium]
MQNINDLQTICRQIADMRSIAEELQRHEARLPALGKNVRRILASIRMLEINFSDIEPQASPTSPDPQKEELR